ncbi:MAG: Ribosomal large subunit pseudouridine synthase B [Chlamydiae bacterium]|nr:Ribosomal large subunit pseudouridine synthase B [Chlamydiota bacterium]
MTKQRLSKVLASAGIASRRACEALIFEGKVSVNGEIATLPQTLVSLDADDIRIESRRIKTVEEKVYYILNKPRNYVCSNKVLGRKKLVIELFPESHRLFTVGRLDRDTTGLLIVTNDGHFAQKIIHPSANIEKEYLVKVNAHITHDHLVAVARGGMVEGGFVKPVRVAKVRKGTLKVIVKEGRKREVRVLVEKAGLEIRELTRIRIGGLHLGPLSEGDYRPLTAAEKEAIIN